MFSANLHVCLDPKHRKEKPQKKFVDTYFTFDYFIFKYCTLFLIFVVISTWKMNL